MDHILLKNVELLLKTEYSRKPSNAFLEEVPLVIKEQLVIYHKGAPLHFGGHLRSTCTKCIKKADRNIWTGVMASFFTGIKPVRLLPFGIFEVYAVPQGPS